MTTVTLPKAEYQDLKKKARAYELILGVFENDLFVPPPTRDAKKVMSEFKKTDRYNKNFLESFKLGLNRSSYFKK